MYYYENIGVSSLNYLTAELLGINDSARFYQSQYYEIQT